MATNPNFRNYQPEQDLIENITIEIIQAMGSDCYYVPREFLSIDRLFGEDPGSYFTKSYSIEMYLQSYKGFEGTDIISQFGLEIKDRVMLILSRKRFKQEVTDKNSSIIPHHHHDPPAHTHAPIPPPPGRSRGARVHRGGDARRPACRPLRPGPPK